MPGLTERLLYRVAKRWIAGYALEDAIRVAHDANKRKLGVILNRLGEHTPDEKLIQGYTEEYLKLLDRIQEEKIQGTISVKPSQLGLAANPTLYKTNLQRILERAGTYEAFVWIDMENSPYTEGTLSTYKEILPSYPQLGVCLQANMKRSESDLKDLLPRGGIIRLVKGAYPESGDIVYKRRNDVEANYIRMMTLLFDGAERFGIGTHDGKLIDIARELAGKQKRDFEFQMLKGIRDDLKPTLIQEGYRVNEYVPYGPEWYNYSKRRMRERKRNILLLLRSLTG
ncbi:MAG TPA: proline dehydrogenase family protein [Candidatus Bathyarchaeia archaeon]|jgi:proline dehydrogenase|nr:proline dehydrogenase family protein [Candidatus Bathyarchaeia archaeon]